MVEERVYVIPLKRVKMGIRKKRAPKAMRYIRRYIAKHTKSKNIKISENVNRDVWKRGIEKIPSKIKVSAKVMEDGTVFVDRAEVKQ